jgi:hypothetical protein
LSYYYALLHLWEPFPLLDFIASEFCFMWLCNEVFVKWSVLWSKVLLQFHMGDLWLVTVAWYSSKICLFCTVGIEADMYNCYDSACKMSLLCWLKKYLMFCFYDLSAMSTACISSMMETVAWSDASCVVSPVLVMCGSITSVVMTYIHAVLRMFPLWFSMLDEAYGNTVAG